MNKLFKDKNNNLYQLEGIHNGKCYLKIVNKLLLNPKCFCLEEDFKLLFTETNMTIFDYLQNNNSKESK